MSGGSYDYACFKVEDMANELISQKEPLRKVFGKHLLLVSKAMHDIEWVDSSDYGEGDEVKAIKDVLGNATTDKLKEVLKSELKEIRIEVEKLMDELESK